MSEGARKVERKEWDTKIVIDFFRHDAKEKPKDGQPDEEVTLTSAGKIHAQGEAYLNDVSQATVFGSSRKRAKQTGLLRMTGGQEAITGEETLEELEEKIKKETGGIGKVATDDRLNFKLEESSPYGAEAYADFKKGIYLKFLVEKSDALAEKLGET